MSEQQDPGPSFLPKNIKPVHYDISIEPDLDSRVYKGTVSMTLVVEEAAKVITAHAHDDIEFDSTSLTCNGCSVSGISLTRHKKASQYLVTCDETLASGSKLELRHSFRGYLNDQLNGFYRTTYKGEDGKERFVASTQGQPTGARRMFPCFDEPGLKATFSMTLVVEHDQDCLMNMDVKAEEKINGKRAVTFNTTPPMSPYLVCFAVGSGFQQFKTDKYTVPISVYSANPSNSAQAEFTLDLAVKTLQLFEKAFDHSYPLPKLDLITFPGFMAGAMENWGLITSGEEYLLWNEKVQGLAEKQIMVKVSVHEMAHLWFGDLVTTKTWDGLWLNEGFANWVALYGTDKFFPEWKVWDTHVAQDLPRALALDSLRNSHPIELKTIPGQEGQGFDAISYEKGSVVLRMIANYLGEDKFLAGVAKYIKKHAYGSTETSNLWASLSEVAGFDVEKVISPFVLQTGYPVLQIEDNESDGTITVTQHRFLKSGDPTPEEDYLWPVPLNILDKNGKVETLVLSEREGTFAVSDFYKINAGQTGFYRTLYPTKRLETLVDACKKGELSVQDRAGIVGDLLPLATAGYLSTASVLGTLKALKEESNACVWQVMLSHLQDITETWRFEGEKVNNALSKFQAYLVSEKVNQEGWRFSKQDDPISQALKVALFRAAAIAKVPEVISAIRQMFNAYKSGDNAAIDPNLRNFVFGASVEHGGVEEFDFLFQEYFATSDPALKHHCSQSLGRTTDPALMQRTLEQVLTDKVAPPDIIYFAGGFLRRAENVRTLWTWSKENWDAAMHRLSPNLPFRPYWLKFCTESFTDREGLGDIEGFFETRPVPGCEKALPQALETIRTNVKWLERDREGVSKWLEANGFLEQ